MVWRNLKEVLAGMKAQTIKTANDNATAEHGLAAMAGEPPASTENPSETKP